jgi:hypothetical protein
MISPMRLLAETSCRHNFSQWPPVVRVHRQRHAGRLAAMFDEFPEVLVPIEHESMDAIRRTGRPASSIPASTMPS